jgi:hypothetical protein
MSFAIDDSDETSDCKRYKALDKVVRCASDREWTMYTGHCFSVR